MSHRDHQHSHTEAHDTPPPKYRKQEQEPAGTEIIEVAPGILRLQLPIRIPGLGHVNCYALEDERGFAVVDPGMPGPGAWREFQAAITRAGIPVKRIHTAIVTHSHPDHFGGAGKLHYEVGADIVAHRSFRVRWSPSEPNDDIDAEAAAEAAGVRAEGVGDDDDPRSAAEAVREHAWDARTPWGGDPPGPSRGRRLRWKVLKRIPGMMPTPTPTTRLRDADTITFAKREWVAVHTPGHTADHLCLLDPAEGVFLSGDHVLPTITPHISGLMTAADPLQLFFDSLDKVKELQPQVRVVLPAHGHPFPNLAGRVDDIKRHHAERLERLHTASKELGRSGTVSDYSHYLFSPRAQGSMADSETYAHLEHLRVAGRAENRRRPDGLLEYDIA